MIHSQFTINPPHSLVPRPFIQRVYRLQYNTNTKSDPCWGWLGLGPRLPSSIKTNTFGCLTYHILVYVHFYMFLEVSDLRVAEHISYNPVLVCHAWTHPLFCLPLLQFYLTTKALHYTYVCDPVVYSPDE